MVEADVMRAEEEEEEEEEVPEVDHMEETGATLSSRVWEGNGKRE